MGLRSSEIEFCHPNKAMEALDKAIAGLYGIFKSYRIKPSFSGCAHCVSPKDSEYLCSTELSQLSPTDLDTYAFKAMTTWGEVNDFKHFLPRLFELVATEDTNCLSSLEVLFGKLAYARWNDWPTGERRAVRSYLEAYWNTCLAKDVLCTDDDSIDSSLCAISCACESIDDFLVVWASQNDATAIRQLGQFIWLNADTILKKNRLWNSFWVNQRAAEETIKWLSSETVRTCVENGRQYLTEHLSYSSHQLEAMRAKQSSIASSG